MPPLYSGSTPVSPTSCMCPENLQRKASRRVLIRAMKQRSTALLGAPHPLCDAKTPRGGKSFWPLVSAISFFRDSGVPESDVWWEMCWTSCRGNGRSSHIGYMRTRYLFSQKRFSICSLFRNVQTHPGGPQGLWSSGCRLRIWQNHKYYQSEHTQSDKSHLASTADWSLSCWIIQRWKNMGNQKHSSTASLFRKCWESVALCP